MSESTHPTKAPPEERPFPWGCLRSFLIVGVMLFILAGVALGPMGHSPEMASHDSYIQQVHSLNLALFSYANDNDRVYPEGNSSTEIFQKLIDGGYCTDPTIFYVPLSGKTEPVPGQKLKPENVSFDLTTGLDLTSPDQLPVVFLTGYRVNYVPGGAAVSLIKPFPRFGWKTPSFLAWLTGWQWFAIHYSDSGGIAVTYRNGKSSYKKLENGSVPDFISSDFKPTGKVHRQLTPDGPLAQ